MFTHMQTMNGQSFSNATLNSALKHAIISDKSSNNALVRIKEILDKNIDYENAKLPNEAIPQITLNIQGGILPKFTRTQDSFNGLGLAVHDTYSTEIYLTNLKITKNDYSALVKFQIQDHFGLDQNDIKNWKFNQFYFFKTWFVLQRSKSYGFKPFFTNMDTCIEIKGSKNA